jgi:nucleoid-associated protein YgaU
MEPEAMTRETRIALLIGLVFIVLFGLVLGQRTLPVGQKSSDQLAVTSLPSSSPAPDMNIAVLHGEDNPPVEIARGEPPRRLATEPERREDIAMPPPPGPGPTDPAPPVVAPPPRPETVVARTYTIQTGDTPTKIARKVYGQEKLYSRILEANKDKIGDARHLVVGVVVTIPPPPAGAAPVAPVPAIEGTVVVVDPAPHGGTAAKTYTIKAGDTLGRIAQETTGTCKNVDKLIKANPGLDPKKLLPGKTIVIPVAQG